MDPPTISSGKASRSVARKKQDRSGPHTPSHHGYHVARNALSSTTGPSAQLPTNIVSERDQDPSIQQASDTPDARYDTPKASKVSRARVPKSNSKSPTTRPPRQQGDFILPPFPAHLTTLREADLTDATLAIQLMRDLYMTLADLMWRTVVYANYFWKPPQNPTGYPYDYNKHMTPRQQCFEFQVREHYWPRNPENAEFAQKRAVESAVQLFLDRVQPLLPGYALANRSMALQLHASLGRKELMTRKKPMEMLVRTYVAENGAGVHLVGLEALSCD